MCYSCLIVCFLKYRFVSFFRNLRLRFVVFFSWSFLFWVCYSVFWGAVCWYSGYSLLVNGVRFVGWWGVVCFFFCDIVGRSRIVGIRLFRLRGWGVDVVVFFYRELDVFRRYTIFFYFVVSSGLGWMER